MHALWKHPGAAVVAVIVCLLGMGAGVLLAAEGGQAEAGVVINELFTNPDIKTELAEFIELYNAGASDLDLSGWSFTQGVVYTFPAGTVLPAGGYLVVAEDPEELNAKFGSIRVGLRMMWVFGPYAGGLDGDGERVTLCDAAGQVVDEVDYQLGFPWPTVGDAVPESVPGNGPSLQLVNPRFDNDLGGSWRSALPTPLEKNSVFSETLPPCVRQVSHSPRQPKSDEVVTVTAKVTDEDGVADVTLLYQTVLPGAYIARSDGLYAQSWVEVAMHDDGLAGDARAGDDVFTAQVPADQQVHRNLVRYRIRATDGQGRITIAPYSDDPQPNFAYFVYDGVPAWRGAVQPGVTPVIEFPAEVMQSVPVYHLISKKSDVEDGTWLSQYGGSDYRWYGTLVYDGEVYDHIRYRMRGGVWRYAMGKHMLKCDFNRGHYFQARDDYGRPYDTKWDKLNFSACIQQGSFGQRGEQGMFEALSFRLFNLAGCPASKTNYVAFRIIDEPYEDGTRNAAHPPITNQGTQYDGDFWGLYMTIEQMDGQFLDEHGLPDGNLIKMDDGNNEVNNQGPAQLPGLADLSQFLGRYGNEAWWRQNVNLDVYYDYYAVYQAIHHGDITGKNWFLYHHPETNQWWQLPWDVDLTWTTYYGSNDPSDPFRRAGVFNYSGIDIECKNRLREVVDLLFNTDQAYQLIDEYAAIIDDPAGGLSIVDADRCMWDYHWVVGNAAYPKYINQSASYKAGQGRFYEEAEDRGYERSFEGMVQVMKDYVVERVNYLNSKAADEAIPNKPVIASTSPAGFPANALTFAASGFSDPQGANTFAAMKWRIAEVAPGSKPPVDEGSNSFVLLPDGATWRYFKGLAEPSAVQGAWRQLDFDDSAWLSGPTAIGFGEAFLSTELADMRYSYTSIYLRKTFDITDVAAFDSLILAIKYDDGVNVWINGKLAFQDNVAGENVPHSDVSENSIENIDFVESDLGSPEKWLVQGRNVIAIQVLNSDLSSSSDCFIDAGLRGLVSQTDEGTEEPEEPPVVVAKKGSVPYEIEAAWESDEIATFANDITIPASAVEPGRTYRVRCRMKDASGRWSRWSNPVQFVAGEPVAAGVPAGLRIAELMYNPPAMDAGMDNDEFEFIELKNVGDETLDLSSVSFNAGVTFDFAAGAVKSLGPGEFVLVVKNEEAFLSRYGSALSGLIAGEYSGKLANDGEEISLVDAWNGTIAQFEYGDGRGWPLAADGGGHSLVPLDSASPEQPQGSLNYPGNWRASSRIAGSPGQDDPANAATVLLNEFTAADDWVELYNTSGEDVSLADWYLSDDVDEPKKWALPAVSVPAGGHAVFNDIAGFGLSRDGEELVLSYLPGADQDRIVDAVSFKAQEEGVSLGRYPDGADYWFALTPSQGAPNANPSAHIVIDELMYHPVDPNEEYIELYNPLDRPMSLGDDAAAWRLDGAVEYSFPSGTSIPAGGRLVIVGFDPAVETSRLVAFAVAYKANLANASTRIVGPWTGSLSNAGERVALERSVAGESPASPIAWVIVDEVIYGDTTPWPASPDGQGDALQRISVAPGSSGNDPANWQAAIPSPGR